MKGKASTPTKEDRRKARLAAELRANLARRKAQARARRAGEGDSRPEGIAAGQDRQGSVTKKG